MNRPKETTYQVDTVHKRGSSYRFNIDNRKFAINLEVFRDILGFCPRIKGQSFTDPLYEDEILAFVRYLGYTREIKYLTDITIDHLHQPWRTFTIIINKCLSRKVSGLDKMRLSRIQILWGMFYKKNVDFVALIWEDLAYQIENKNAKKTNKMYYLRFTKAIINHYIKQNPSISLRNKLFMHTARDDTILGILKFVSNNEDVQVYGALIPKVMTNQDMMSSESFQPYYAIATGAAPPKIKKQRRADSSKSFEDTLTRKSPRIKRHAKVSPAKSKKKTPAKANTGKSLNILSEVALTKDAQLKEALRRRVPDVPKVDSDSDAESWGDSDDEDDIDVDKSYNESTDDGKDDDDDDDDNDGKDDDEGNYDENEEEDVEENNDAHVTLTASQKTEGQTQSSSVSFGFTSKFLDLENVNPANYTLTTLIDTSPQQKSSLAITTTPLPPPPPQHATTTPEITSPKPQTYAPDLPDFASLFKFNERVFHLEQEVSHLKQDDKSAQVSESIKSRVPVLIDKHLSTRVGYVVQVAFHSYKVEFEKEAQAEQDRFIDIIDKTVKELVTDKVKGQLNKILPKKIADFATPMIERNIVESHERVVLTKSASQPKSTYEAAASLREFELKKILLDKMNESESYRAAQEHRDLYDCLAKSYNLDKDLFNTYGKAYSLKRDRDDKDKDEDPSAGSDRGMKRQKSGKEAEPSQEPKSKSSKSTCLSKGHTQSPCKSTGKSAHAKESGQDSGEPHDQEFVMGNTDDQPADKAVTKDDWWKKPEKPPTPDCDWNKRQSIDFRPAQPWITKMAKDKEPPQLFDKFMNTPIDFSAFVLNRLKIENLTQETLVKQAFDLLKGTCMSFVKLEYHFEEVYKAVNDRLDWNNPEGDVYPFDLSKPLPLIQDDKGRQAILVDYFISNNLLYLKGGSASRKYATSTTKTKAAMYDNIKGIEDMVLNLWSPTKVAYDKHAVWDFSHWGPKRKRYYGYACHFESSHDVFSTKRIIGVTHLDVDKRFDYGRLKEITIRREDQELYTFKEGDFPRLNYVTLKIYCFS
ncbi:hypothetical protein Tco_0891670 [Tanacetum coccineum]|uniref:Uncharacterized protein n=1 Tax=Tanacetum coccineum TaxID=301880 RepID=A0ABQ5C6V8_9ASTR